MARLWMTVFLVLLLAQGYVAVVDTTTLANLIQRLRQRYSVSGMFSLAVSLKGGNLAHLEEIFQQNPPDKVEGEILKGRVYRGFRLALAKVGQPEHAELRVLKDLNLDSIKGDMLVIYSYASPCPTTCTNICNRYNIINPINNLINIGQWSTYAFVFEKVFNPRDCKKGLKESELKRALTDLADGSQIKLPDIFRCYKSNNKAFTCISCSSAGKVTPQCVDYNVY
ncbi:uncharacterized protein LOC114439922 [Parambassis ranga]|uniref:Uncharacterized protein LOC114439922 n=1 Tax=Parambassis ranga TaxID=210632 RepID=A0A6P7IRN3_9TELE|nr:uncharacterized protein LOC114439922 [Parambassis ranga]